MRSKERNSVIIAGSIGPHSLLCRMEGSYMKGSLTAIPNRRFEKESKNEGKTPKGSEMIRCYQVGNWTTVVFVTW